MLGAIIGDILGSRFVENRITTKEFDLFGPNCAYTDKSVCTAAVAEILLHDLSPTETIQGWCRRHHNRRYGGWLFNWVHSHSPVPYDSDGNGAATRVSPAAFLNPDDLDAALAASDLVTEVTHNHEEGIRGARATVHAIWLANQSKEPEHIRKTIANTYAYDLTMSVAELRAHYSLGPTCQGTVPPAITCALEAHSYEDAVRNAVSLGGDADALATIAGAVAEALFSLPPDICLFAEDHYLTQGNGHEIRDIMNKMYASRG